MERLKTQFSVSFQTLRPDIKSKNPRNLVYLPVISDKINKMETVVTDQNGKQLNLRGENLTIRYHLREILLHDINELY